MHAPLVIYVMRTTDICSAGTCAATYWHNFPLTCGQLRVHTIIFKAYQLAPPALHCSVQVVEKRPLAEPELAPAPHGPSSQPAPLLQQATMLPGNQNKAASPAHPASSSEAPPPQVSTADFRLTSDLAHFAVPCSSGGLLCCWA
jgi:hypothetical protein